MSRQTNITYVKQVKAVLFMMIIHLKTQGFEKQLCRFTRSSVNLSDMTLMATHTLSISFMISVDLCGRKYACN